MATMTHQGGPILSTQNPLRGFCAACKSRGYNVRRVWNAASRALAMTFDLKPPEVRDFLDSDAGQILANDLMFIEGGPQTSQVIVELINARLTREGWRRWYDQTIAEVRAAK